MLVSVSDCVHVCTVYGCVYAASNNFHFLTDMRKLGSEAGSNTKGTVTAFPRQLESLIRLAEAHAKMRYKFVVDFNLCF